MNARPLMLDGCCSAGGTAMGYWRVGFDVVGIDIKPQPRFPFPFEQGDFLEIDLSPFAAVHVSPPCQHYSAMSNCRPGLSGEYPDLIGAVRDKLRAWGGPYVIENVEGAPLAGQPTLAGENGILLCGRMFGLDLYRHRLFESNIPLIQLGHPPHDIPASRAGHWEPGTTMSVAGHVNNIAEARRVMGIDWMNREELAEAVPPLFTEYVGTQLLSALEKSVA